MPNRLARETSPYLLQHKDNPVDWYPWGSEALEQARSQDKPIFLSIGYSACHWCHVMERESFENREIAALMNDNFVNIKVDREERPDLDSIYMVAVQALSGHGGWPMSVFLTPEGKPFYGGTYYPPEDRGGLPSFPRLLTAIAEAYRTRRDEILGATDRVVSAIEAQGAMRGGDEPLDIGIMRQAFTSLAADFDSGEGGFGIQPKFPQPLVHEFLLRYWLATGSEQALHMVEQTLRKMALGGMYDQLGGGFHRYSTDRLWLVPHFEKMLYDNALLGPLYLHAWQATGKPLYRRITEEVLRYVSREMLDPAGGFYSAQDADSEGEEGKFFVWVPSEITEVVGREASRAFCAYYGVTRDGNFEGKNILHIPRDEEAVAADLQMTVDELRTILIEARSRLLAARDRRVRPGLDDKVLVSWNALMMKAFAECGAALDNPGWVDIARRNADCLLENLLAGGRLLRTWKVGADGGGARLKAYLEDYAALADGLVSLYEATFEQRWIDQAISLTGTMIDLFWDEAEGVFFDTGIDHESLVVRPRDVFDNAAPCGGSLAVMALLRLSRLTGTAEYQRYALSSLASVRDLMARAPNGFGHWLAGLDFHLSPAREIAVVGPRHDAAVKSLLDVVYGRYIPNLVLAGAPGEMDPAPTPLLAGRGMIDNRPTAYVCENYACRLPVVDAEGLADQLSG